MAAGGRINDDSTENVSTPLVDPASKFKFDLSIYTVWEPIRTRILLISSLAPVLNPLTGSFFLPALPTIIEEFDATQTQIALVYSLYFLFVAISKLVWGPFVDKYSRKWCLVIALLMFILFTYVTAYAFDMWFLIVLRTMTGIPQAVFFIIANSIISDIYPPNKRGFAMGVRSVPMLVNVLFGSPIGGLLTLYVGWRSTMVVLALAGTLVYLLVLLLVPETLNKERANKIPFSPLKPLKLVCNPKIFCITLTGGATLSTLFLTTFCISTVVADENNLNPFVIGLSIVPAGISAVIFSTIGGKICDILGKKYGRGARLLFSTICFLISSLMFIPFALSFTSNVWVPIVLSAIMGAFRGSAGPGFSTFCIEEHPQNVSAVLGGLSSGYMVISFLLLLIAPITAPAIGWAWVSIIICIFSIIVSIPCLVISLMTIREYFQHQ